MMLNRNGSIALNTVILSLALGLGASSVQAECKGSSQSACESDNKCSWVKGYTRKDGAKVAAHCKSKPKTTGNSGAKKSDSKKKTDSKKKSDSKK